MIRLSDVQQVAVRQWLAEGASLSEVQQRLKEEFGVALTYMDVRLLTLDIGAQVQDKPEPPKKEEATSAANDPDDGDDELSADAGGKVTVSMDALMRPGALVSGDVTFSDGTKAHWLLDQMGRLGLEGAPANYQPSGEDVQAFQVELQKLLAAKGYR